MQSPLFDTATANACWQIDFGCILIGITDNNSSKSSGQKKF